MQKESQTKKIWKALKRGRRLTMLSMHQLCGSLNGHRRLAEVERQYGVTVRCTKIKYKGRWISQWSLS